MQTPLDLSVCLDDSSRDPAWVQPHGALVALTPDLRITHVSQNAGLLLGRPTERLLGREATALVPEQELAWLAAAAAADAGPAGPSHRLWDLEPGRATAWVHQHAGRVILELEPHRESPEDASSRQPGRDQLRTAMNSIQSASAILEVVQQITESVAGLTGYDRVMCFRFFDDLSAEVIAECRNPQIDPYLGIRYPAPSPRPQSLPVAPGNLVRSLADSHASPVSLYALSGGSLSIDIGRSVLRSLPPEHLDYLMRRGIAAIVSASIFCDGQLWGLISCHHSRPLFLTTHLRRALHQLASALGARVERLTHAARRSSRTRVLRALSHRKPEPYPGNLIQQLLLSSPGIRGLLNADGVALAGPWGNSKHLRTLATAGRTPPAAWIEQFAAWAAAQSHPIGSVHSFQHHPSGVAELPGFPAASSAGALSLVLASNPPTVFLLFRDERVQNLRWGGDVLHPVLPDSGDGQTTQRRSFAEYQETRLGSSAPWTAADLEAAGHIRAAICHHLRDAQSVAVAVQACYSELRNLVRSPAPLTAVTLQNLPDGILLITARDGSGPRLRYANPAFARLFGGSAALDRDDARVARLFPRLGLPEDLLERALFMPRLLESGPTGSARRSLRVSAECLLQVYEPAAHRCLYSMTFAHTPNESVALEELSAAKLQAEQACLAKFTLLSNMSHEIRTPMNGILGTAQILALTALTADQKECVDLIHRSAEALMTIVNEVLDFSRLEAGRLELESVPFDLSGVIEEAMNRMQSMAAKKRLTLRMARQVSFPRQVVGDPLRLRQILLNLVSNAIKFTRIGEVTVTVTRRRIDAGRARFLFTVRDTGIGIAPADLARLFQQFQQPNASANRKYGGTGFGLAISKLLIERMGGTIEVTSTPGQGSCFQFELVLLEKDSLCRRMPPTPEPLLPLKRILPGEPAKPAILLADDHEINRTVTRKLLAQLGYSLELASNGREAVEKWSSGAFSLILMDCQMPEMDGFEATARIREQEGDGPHTPIIALTANALSGDRQHCLQAGMDDYLSKPIHIDALRDMILRWTKSPALSGREFAGVSR